MIRTILLSLGLLCLMATANDSVYNGSGNQLVPLTETDIAITREVLTISLRDDGTTDIDVWYELFNKGPEKTVLMGFEADAPYAGEPEWYDGTHPNIHDFRVEMNDVPVLYQTAVVRPDIQQNGLQPLDIRGLADSPDWENYYGRTFVWQKGDSVINYTCAYYFPAKFREGKNTIHHTYAYNYSFGAGTVFWVDYKLTPATRWANGQIDDFTLRIRADHTAKHFVIADEKLFSAAPFRITEGMGKQRTVHYQDASAREFSLRNGTVEWHSTAFCPTSELRILSADVLESFDNPTLAFFYDRNAQFFDAYSPLQHFLNPTYWGFTPKEDEAFIRRVLCNLPYAHCGYVFRNKQLREFFESKWWYMPDSTWKASSADFTPSEQQLIKQYKQ